MDNRPLVVLLGKSLLMDGIALGLGDEQLSGMVRLDVVTGDMREKMQTLKPDLIVFELEDPAAQVIIPFLKNQPDILLIGLDLDRNRAIVLNSCQHLAESINDLQQLVQKVVNREASLTQWDGLLASSKNIDA